MVSKNSINRCSQLVEGANQERLLFLLMEAVLSNSPPVLETLITHLELAGHLMVDIVDMMDRTGRTLLSVAVKIRSREMVILLAGKEGRAVNLVDKTGDAPLHVAVRLGAPEIVQALLKTDTCNPNIVNSQGQYPLHIAVTHNSRDHDDCLDLLLHHKMVKVNQTHHLTKTRTPLILAVHHNHLNAVKTLLHHKDTLLDCEDTAGITLAEIAYSEASGHLLRLLLGAGAQAGRLESSVPEFRYRMDLSRQDGWQDLRREITEEEKLVLYLRRRSALPLVEISSMVVRKVLIRVCHPRSIFPLVERMVRGGEISRGVGQLLTWQG